MCAFHDDDAPFFRRRRRRRAIIVFHFRRPYPSATPLFFFSRDRRRHVFTPPRQLCHAADAAPIARVTPPIIAQAFSMSDLRAYGCHTLMPLRFHIFAAII